MNVCGYVDIYNLELELHVVKVNILTPGRSLIVRFQNIPESKVDIVLYTCQSCNKINPGV